MADRNKELLARISAIDPNVKLADVEEGLSQIAKATDVEELKTAVVKHTSIFPGLTTGNQPFTDDSKFVLEGGASLGEIKQKAAATLLLVALKECNTDQLIGIANAKDNDELFVKLGKFSEIKDSLTDANRKAVCDEAKKRANEKIEEEIGIKNKSGTEGLKAIQRFLFQSLTKSNDETALVQEMQSARDAAEVKYDAELKDHLEKTETKKTNNNIVVPPAPKKLPPPHRSFLPL